MPERYLYTQDSLTAVSGSNYYTWSAILSQEIGKAKNTLLKIRIAIYQHDNDRVQLITVQDYMEQPVSCIPLIMFPYFPAPIEIAFFQTSYPRHAYCGNTRIQQGLQEYLLA